MFVRVCDSLRQKHKNACDQMVSHSQDVYTVLHQFDLRKESFAAAGLLIKFRIKVNWTELLRVQTFVVPIYFKLNCLVGQLELTPAPSVDGATSCTLD